MHPYRRKIELDIDSKLDDQIDDIGIRLFQQHPNTNISKCVVVEMLIKMGIESAERGIVDTSKYTVSNVIPLDTHRLK